jgi:predicted Zn-dependent peptidase
MSIDRDKIVAQHHKAYRPDHAYLTVTGDFDSKAMLARLRMLFGAWEKSGETLPPLPAVKATPRPGIYVVDRDLEQSNIVLAHWGVDRTNPDRFAIDLMNDILGGGSFSSRVTERVRSDEGLAYSAGTSYGTSDREIGLFRASVQTKTESTVKAVGLLLDEIDKMRKGAVSDNEFDTVREAILYSYVFRFDDAEQNVGRLMGLEIDGLPADWFEKEFAGYQAVTKEDVEKAARKYLHPDQLTIFIVGKLDAFRTELAELGEIHEIQLEEFEMPRGAFGPDREGGGPPGRGGRRGEGD